MQFTFLREKENNILQKLAYRSNFSLVFGDFFSVLLWVIVKRGLFCFTFWPFTFSPEVSWRKCLATLSFCLSAFFSLSPELVLSFNDCVNTYWSFPSLVLRCRHVYFLFPLSIYLLYLTLILIAFNFHLLVEWPFLCSWSRFSSVRLNVWSGAQIFHAFFRHVLSDFMFLFTLSL